MVVELSTWRMTRALIAMQSAAVMERVFRLTGLLMLSLKLNVQDLAKSTPQMCTTNYQYIILSRLWPRWKLGVVINLSTSATTQKVRHLYQARNATNGTAS